MTVLIGTGNALLDNHLQLNINKQTEKVNYLEEIHDIVSRISEEDVVILSSYLPSVNDETEQQRMAAFNKTIQLVLEKGTRIVFLTEILFPLQDLYLLYDLGIYDLIVSEDNGNVNLKDIINKITNPTSSQEAKTLLERISKKQSPYDQRGMLKNAASSELYQHLEYREVPGVNEVSHQPLYETNPVSHFENEVQQVNTDPHNYKDSALTRLTPTRHPIQPSRQKAVEKSATEHAEAKLFAFWAASTEVGKRTLSQSYAMEIAKLGYSVLYVEFDYLNPTLALTTALSHPDKNLYQLSLSQDSFDLGNYIANKMDVQITKDMASLFNEISNDFYFLGLPQSFDTDSFPSITNEQFLSTLLSALKDMPFDAVIMNLPNDVENLFSFPVMVQSDVVFAVTTANPVRINEYRAMNKLLSDTHLDMEKWQVLVNKVGEEISKDVCDQLLHERALISVPYDLKRPYLELDLHFGSPTINQKMQELAALYGFIPEEPVETKRKGLFGKKK